ncbi:serine/threonine-protein kinase, partial [Chloroflexota bacterium]
MIGTQIADRYQINRELGEGGMGVVYHAHDTLLNRDVAVKILSETELTAVGRERLLNEAQAAAQLNHPNIITIHDAGESEGKTYIVMELTDGESLHSNPPQETAEIVWIARQVSAALDHAHQHGIVHRDLKPENVLFTLEGTRCSRASQTKITQFHG